MENMDKLRAIIDNKIKAIMKDLDYVGAKKPSRDAVQRNMDALKTELADFFADEADNLKNRLVINRLQALVTDFRQMSNL